MLSLRGLRPKQSGFWKVLNYRLPRGDDGPTRDETLVCHHEAPEMPW